jgi:DNA replicative helicase MCM subunit Mcm2 (Cdc46/Mcm family)
LLWPITHVHRTGAHPPLGFDVVDSKLIRAHIADARKVLPVIPPDGSLTEYIVDNYVAMRAQETEDGDNAKGYTSPRVLLSILRLGQALARLRLADVVEKEDVDENHLRRKILTCEGGAELKKKKAVTLILSWVEEGEAEWKRAIAKLTSPGVYIP